MEIQSININGIFERQNIQFDFSKTPFFLVGPNGTGKSTALKILHNILTGSFSRMGEMPFSSVGINFDGRELLIERGEFIRVARLRSSMVRAMKRSGRRTSMPFPEKWEDAEPLLRAMQIGTTRTSRPMSTAILRDFEEIYDAAVALLNFIEQHTLGKVLYFPTYRRVEKDLHELLEDDEDGNDIDGSNLIEPKIAERFSITGEVVGFGGQDIMSLLTTTASQIEVEARQALNEHSVRFLEALSTKKTEETNQARTLIQSSKQTDELLNKIVSFSPSHIDIDAIRDNINGLRNTLSKKKTGRLTQQQDMTLFYVGELIKLFHKIDGFSRPLRQFTELINKYLKPIKFSRLRESDNQVAIFDQSDNEITLDQLSSGEKQIIAFFAFLILRPGHPIKYIIIDEPELSLSVSWQKTLIYDIQQFSRANFLVSATHSPFIFGQFSLDNVISLGDL